MVLVRIKVIKFLCNLVLDLDNSIVLFLKSIIYF